MGTVIPVRDASRRPLHRPVVTRTIILINAIVFVLELQRGDAFVTKWSAVPADVIGGHHHLGASGTIAAVMGAFLVTFPRDRVRSVLVIFVFVRMTLIPAALLIGVWFLIQLVSLGTIAQTQTGGVAYLAHVGGLVFGAVTARLFEDPRRLAAQRAAFGSGGP